MAERYVDQASLENFDHRYRVNFINALSGFKSANLIGTKSEAGINNVALFSSAVHLGASPSLMGFVFRPDSVPRDTLTNIRSSGVFTVNHVNHNIFKQAHLTSARYQADESEFEACGLEPEFIHDFFAPAVAQSQIKMGFELVEELPIKANGTIFIVAQMLWVMLPETIIADDGYVDIEAADTIAVSGLDSYHDSQRLDRLAYAKPFTAPSSIKV